MVSFIFFILIQESHHLSSYSWLLHKEPLKHRPEMGAQTPIGYIFLMFLLNVLEYIKNTEPLQFLSFLILMEFSEFAYMWKLFSKTIWRIMLNSLRCQEHWAPFSGAFKILWEKKALTESLWICFMGCHFYTLFFLFFTAIHTLKLSTVVFKRPRVFEGAVIWKPPL